ncbi:MAG: Gfo/Idh/MocA family oxidoreductase [bacterium]
MSRSIAVVGAGNWGKNLVRVFDSLKTLHTVCDVNLTACSGVGTSNGVHLTTDFTTVLNEPEITGVAIATPAATHFELVKAALLAEKDVFVEKPLALDLTQAEQLVRLAEEKERILMVGHILRYHPAIVRLCDMIEKGELGRIDYIYSNRLNLGRLRTEENILWSFAPHDISVVLALVQERPTMVSAHGEAFLQKNIPDVTLTTLEFPSGVHAYTFVSWLHPFKEQRLVVVGSKQMAVFEDNGSGASLALYPHDIRWHQGRIPVALKGEKVPIEVPNDEPLRIECEHFLESVATRIPPLTDGHEGLKVLEVLSVAQQSLEKAGRVITLSPARNGNRKIITVPLAQKKPALAASLLQPNPSPESTPTAYASELGEDENFLNATELVERISQPEPEIFIHPTAIVDPKVTVGPGTKIWHFTHISSNARIGKNCVLGQNVFVAEGVTIGDNCKVQNNVSLYKGVCLEKEVFCGPSCVFTNVINPRAFIERKTEFKPTLVKRGASIGANATIVCGNTIGRYALVGAGAVVTRDIPDYALVTGVPARPVGWVCKCGTKLIVDDRRARCPNCGNEYQPDDECGLKPLKEQ